MEWFNSHLSIASPFYFLFIIPFIFFFVPLRAKKEKRGVPLPDARILKSSTLFSGLVRRSSNALLLSAAISLVLALVSPGVPKVSERHATFSRSTRDIVATIDVSGSMSISLREGLNKDETPFDIARESLRSLCEHRPADRFALLVFSDQGPYFARSFTNDCKQLIAPLQGKLDDHSSLVSQFSNGTDIVEALLSTPFLFSKESSGSQIVLLLSDLGHGGPASDVVKAISLLEKRGIRVYVLGINSDSSVASAIKSYADHSSHVRLFQIQKSEDLQAVYRAIDSLEPSNVSLVSVDTVSVNEANHLFLWITISILVAWSSLQVVVRRL